MKLKLLFLCISTFIAGYVSAQFTSVPIELNKPVAFPQSKITADGDNATMYLNYSTKNISKIFGVAAGYDVEAMILIPKELAKKYAGSSLTQISVGFGQAATNAKVFIRNSLTGNAVYTQDVTFTPLQWNTISLNTPYVIKENEDLYIGFSFRGGGSSAYYSVCVDDSEQPDPNGGWIRFKQAAATSYGAWQQISSQGFSNLCVVGIVKGTNYPDADVQLHSVLTPYSQVDVNGPFPVIATVENMSPLPVTSLEVSYQIDNNEKVSKTISGLNIPNNEKTDVIIPDIDFDKVVGSDYTVTIAIEKINNLPDEDPTDNTPLSGTVSTWNATQAPIIVSTTPANKNVLVEEFTGIYCQYCPDGHKRVNQLMAANPNRVFAINIHQGVYAQPESGDPDFRTRWGNAIANQTGLGGYPAGTVNRHIFGTNTVTALDRGGFATYSPQILSQSSYVNVKSTATLDFETRELIVDVELYYTANGSATNFLNVALLQDGILGPQTGASTWYPEMLIDGQYQHNHMLRDLFTGQWGELITTTASGNFVAKRYKYIIPENYNAVPVDLNKLVVLAFVTEGHQEVITATESEMSISFYQEPKLHIIKATQLVQHSADLLVKENMTFTNIYKDPITSLEVQYDVAGVTNAENTFTVDNLNVLPGANATIELPLFYVAGATPSNLTISVNEINGVPVSGIQIVTQVSKDVSQMNGNAIKVEIWQDQYGSETTWKLFGVNGTTVVGSGGPYANLTTATTRLQTKTISLTQTGCYRFEIYDSYGDGINSGVGAGRYQLSADGIVFTSGDGKFGRQDTKYISVNSLSASGIDNVSDVDTKIYIEDGVLYISSNYLVENITILNLSGQIILNKSISGNSVSVAELPAGVYIAKVKTIANEHIVKVVK